MIKEKHRIVLAPKFDVVVSKSNDDSIKVINEISDLEQLDEDYMSMIFTLKKVKRARGIGKLLEKGMNDGTQMYLSSPRDSCRANQSCWSGSWWSAYPCRCWYCNC